LFFTRQIAVYALLSALKKIRKGFGCQTALLKIIEDWKKALDENKYIADKIKRIGPKIEPCGTPLYTVSKELQIVFTFTHCFLPDK
jgi:hypothetical protein